MTNKPPEGPVPEIYTTDEAAAYCGMAYERFRGYVKTGQVKPDLVKPKANFYTRATLDAFKAAPKRKAGKPRTQVACPSCGHHFPLEPRVRRKAAQESGANP